MASGFAAEMADVRALLDTNWTDPAVIAWPGQNFTPPDPAGDPANPVHWLDVDFNSPASDHLAFGGDRRRFSFLDVAIYVEPGSDADANARAHADTLDGIFDGQDSATLIYHVQRSELAEGGMSQGFWRRDWTLPIERHG